MANFGLVVFVVGWIGAQTGVIAVPGDRHHVLSQFAGLGLVMVVSASAVGDATNVDCRRSRWRQPGAHYYVV